LGFLIEQLDEVGPFDFNIPVAFALRPFVGVVNTTLVVSLPVLWLLAPAVTVLGVVGRTRPVKRHVLLILFGMLGAIALTAVLFRLVAFVW